MAGILKRFTDIMSANINALLDKAEDPAKMIDQYLRNLESDLGNVKAETAAIMAEEKRAKRELDECINEVDKMHKYAEKALIAGNEADAKTFLTKKAQFVEKQSELQKVYDAAAANAAKMKSMHDKLVGDINELNSRKDAIKAKVAVAKTQEKLNKIGSGIQGANNSMSAFDRMEEKADRMLDEAVAMAELNSSKEDDIEDLMDQYDGQSETAVDDELAALKAKMGL
jgi:phage shock protein A